MDGWMDGWMDGCHLFGWYIKIRKLCLNRLNYRIFPQINKVHNDSNFYMMHFDEVALSH
jgi:hypothetical protein